MHFSFSMMFEAFRMAGLQKMKLPPNAAVSITCSCPCIQPKEASLSATSFAFITTRLKTKPTTTDNLHIKIFIVTNEVSTVSTYG